MAVAFVDKVGGCSNGGSPSHSIAWTGGAVAVGNLLVAVGYVGNAGAVSATMTTNGGGAFTVDVGPSGIGSIVVCSRIVTAVTEDDGPMTFAWDGSRSLDMAVFRLSGSFDASRLRASATSELTASGTTYPSGTTAATPQSGDFAVVLCASNAGDAAMSAWSNSFISRGAVVTGGWGHCSTKALTASGAVSTTGTGNSGPNRVGVIAVYKEAVAGGPQTATLTGVASAEALGTPTPTPGPVTRSLTGIPGAEAFGTPTPVAGPVTTTLSGIPTAQAFGSPTVTAGAVTVSALGVASGETLGTPTVTVGPPPARTVGLTGIPSAQALGVPLLWVVVPLPPFPYTVVGQEPAACYGFEREAVRARERGPVSGRERE